MTVADNPAIVGAGTTDRYGKFPDRTRLDLAAEALAAALDDAGLAKGELDGMVMNMGYPIATNYDRLCEALGLELRFVDQKWSHGRWVGPTLCHAAMAVEAGLADFVAAGLGLKFTESGGLGGEHDTSLTEVGSLSEHFTRPWYGMTAPVGGNALATRYYMERYGAESADLAHVAVQFREHAALDDRSQYTDAIDVDDHQASPWIVEPLRLYDCAAVSDGGAYVIVTSAERADSCDSDPAYITAMEGLHAGREEYVFSRPGMAIRTHAATEYDPSTTDHVYDAAGVSRDDVDALYTYDAFASNVWFALERWGFCDPGTAHTATRDGAIGLDGRLPMNTNGGLLSNGHISGWNHLVEMYDQLRGRCGDRQLPDASTVQWATPFGDAVILEGA